MTTKKIVFLCIGSMVTDSSITKKALPVINSATLCGSLTIKLFLFAFGRNVRQIVGTAADRRIGRPATRDFVSASAVNTTRREPLTVDGFDEDACDLL